MKRILLACLLALLFSLTAMSQYTVFPQNPSCSQLCNGSAVLSPGGSYYAQWENGDTGQAVQGLCAGQHLVVVYNAQFIPIDTVFFILNSPPPIAFSSVHYDVSCFGANDGSIVEMATGGTPPYTYMWSNGAVNPGNLTNLPAGAYAVTVADANGCTATAFDVVNQPTAILVNDTVINATSCSACNGSIHLGPSGGTPPYSYAWLPAGSTTQSIVGLCAGTYTCNVTDVNGCTETAVANVSAPSNGLLAVASNTGVHCNDTDTATVTAAFGVAPYSVTWGDGASSSWGAGPFTHVYGNIATYNITVYDTAGCSYFLVDTGRNYGVSVTLTPHYPNCAAPTSGKVFATATGGNPPYFYLWNTGATVDSIINQPSGSYSVTVTDSLGCTVTAGEALVNTNGLFAYAYGNAASCDSGGVGSATIAVNGGSGMYSYTWATTPPQSTQTAIGILPGVYGFTVTDNNGGCSVASTANIAFTSFSFYVYLQVDSYPNCGNNNGAVTAHVYSGAAPYTYHWDDNQTTQTALHLAPGAHSVTVTDAGGCSAQGFAYLQTACFNTIAGNIFDDGNGNCSADSGDSPLPSASVYATNGVNTYYGYTDGWGNYSIQVNDTGTYTVHASPYYYYQSCGNIVPCGNANQPVTFHGYNNTVTLNFGFAGSSGFDLYLHPGWSSANPGFPKNYWVYYGNQSVQSFTGAATVTFKYDNNLVYQSSDPPLPAHNAAAHTLSWVVNGVGNWDFRGHCYFNVPSSLPAGYHLQSDFYITPTVGDCDSSNNHEHFSELVTSSRDPNEKEVSPAGSIYDEDSVLTYTIHFQNTGTDTTWFVIIKDTLSHNLDPLTVRNLASSHPYSSFNISGEGILTWVFNPVYLVDSATNEPASKGFVTFSIHKRNNLPIGSTISNKAHIYFDYNEPVVTNTVSDTVADPTYIFEVRGSRNVSVVAYPNPFSQSTNIVITGLNEKFDFTLFDVTGRMKKNFTAIETNRFEMKRDDLAAGVYFYKITTGSQQVAYGKLVVE